MIDSHLTRVENALDELVDSISSYHPSIPAAESLLAADEELLQRLKQLHAHQRNEQRIQELRHLIDQQNREIASSLQLLADTRTDLLSVPSNLPHPKRKDVDSTELLDFARRIARFSVPSNFQVPAVATSPNGETAQTITGKDEAEIGMQSLVDEEKRWLDPWTGVLFTPWPSEAMIRSSALARLQTGGDLGELYGHSINSTMEGDEQLEGNTGVDASNEADSHLAPDAHRKHRVKKEEKPAVFGGLDLYDPDVDD